MIELITTQSLLAKINKNIKKFMAISTYYNSKA
jgi:hypothetical protein